MAGGTSTGVNSTGITDYTKVTKVTKNLMVGSSQGLAMQVQRILRTHPCDFLCNFKKRPASGVLRNKWSLNQ